MIEGYFIIHFAPLPLEVVRPIWPTLWINMAVKWQRLHFNFISLYEIESEPGKTASSRFVTISFRTMPFRSQRDTSS